MVAPSPDPFAQSPPRALLNERILLWDALAAVAVMRLPPPEACLASWRTWDRRPHVLLRVGQFVYDLAFGRHDEANAPRFVRVYDLGVGEPANLYDPFTTRPFVQARPPATLIQRPVPLRDGIRVPAVMEQVQNEPRSVSRLLEDRSQSLQLGVRVDDGIYYELWGLHRVALDALSLAPALLAAHRRLRAWEGPRLGSESAPEK